MRAKFRISAVQDQGFDIRAKEDDPTVAYDGDPLGFRKTAERVDGYPVYSSDPDDPNRVWSESTPSGSVMLLITNRAAWGHFTVGQEVYLDLTPVGPKTA